MAIVVPVVCISNMIYLTNFSAHHHAWPLCVIVSDLWIDIRQTPPTHVWILICLISCSVNGTKTTLEAWHNVIVTVMSPLRKLDISGSDFKWYYANGFLRQYYPLLTAWDSDYPEQVMFAPVSNGSGLMCTVSNGGPSGHSVFYTLVNSSYGHV